MTDDKAVRTLLSVGVVLAPLKVYGCGLVAMLSRTVASSS
jgi:hypothetical protein